MNKRIGLFGGSFDPIHFGHLISARSIGERLGLSRVVLIPAARPPHKEGGPVADADDRLAMARLAVAEDPFFEVSDCELHRSGPSYTIDTVLEFVELNGPPIELFWIIGADSLPELPTWHRIGDIVDSVRIVTAARPGWKTPGSQGLAGAIGQERMRAVLGDCISTPEIDISSTDIRSRVGNGLSIRYLTPPAVVSYIESGSFYRTSP